MQQELKVFNMAHDKAMAVYDEWEKNPRGKSILQTFATELKRQEAEAEAKAKGVRPAASAPAASAPARPAPTTAGDHRTILAKLPPHKRLEYFRAHRQQCRALGISI